jgi:F-type H+-transporting ATPase subunit delta
MSIYRIASRYAKSILELAVEKNRLEEVKNDFDQFVSIGRSNRKFILFLKNPIIHVYKKSAIIRALFENKFDKITMGFMEIVTRKGRSEYLFEIGLAFLEKYHQHKGIVSASVETPIKIDKYLKDRFEILVRDIHVMVNKVELSEKINPELIGGFILTVGDKQIDNSVSKKLRDLKKNLKV